MARNRSGIRVAVAQPPTAMLKTAIARVKGSKGGAVDSNYMPTNTVTLASLSMLRVHKDVEQQDYIDYFLSFFKHVLRDVGLEPVTTTKVKSLLHEEFGLHVPAQAVELVLKRLTRSPHRVLEKVNHQWRVMNATALVDIGPRRSAAMRDIDSLIIRLIDYTKERFGHTWSESEASDALTAYVAQFSIDFLSAFERNTALPSVPRVGDESVFIINAFVDECIKNDPDDLERLVVVVKGTMLANSLLCPDLDYVHQKFGNVTFYLDTPLVLRLLDLDADPRQVTVIDLIELLKSLRGRVAVFQHTVDEVRSVLGYYESNISNARVQHWRMAAIRNAGTTASDICLLSEKLESKLIEYGIDCEHPIRYTRDYQIDETLLGKVLYDDIPYRNDKGRDFDVNSMRCVYTLREGRRPRQLEDSVAVLVTSNTLLAKTAYEFGRAHESTREVSSIVTDFTVANLAWLKSPVQHDSLPFMEMVAAAYSALNPSEALWNKMLTVADRLRQTGEFTQNDHELLRVSPIAQRELMHLTLGSEASFTPETAHEMLARIQADLVQEATTRYSEEIDIQEKRFQEEKVQHEIEKRRRNEEIEEERRNRNAESEQKQKLIDAEQRRYKRLFNSATQVGRFISCIIGIFLVVLVVLSIAVPVALLRIEPSDDRTKKLLGSLLFFVSIAGALWAIPSAIFGTSIIGLLQKMGRWFRRKTFVLLYRIAFGEIPSSELVIALEGEVS